MALTDDLSTQALVNPAASAAVGASFHFIFPSLDLYSRGASFSNLTSNSSDINGGDASQALKLAEDFAAQPTTLTMGLSTGFTGTLGVSAQGEMQGLVNPGPIFSQWVRAGLPTTIPDLQTAVTNGLITPNPALTAAIQNGDISSAVNLITAGTHVTGAYVYSLPSVTYGRGFSLGAGRLFAGTQMSWMHGETHEWTIEQDPSVTDQVSLTAVEDPTQKHTSSGFGDNLGFIYQPRNPKLQFAMVMDNFIEPKMAGIDLPFMMSVGAGWKPARKVTIAADIYNINRAYNESTQLRAGAEYRFNGLLALRGGYSGQCFTCGICLLGFDFAYTANQTSMLSHSLAF